MKNQIVDILQIKEKKVFVKYVFLHSQILLNKIINVQMVMS